MTKKNFRLVLTASGLHKIWIDRKSEEVALDSCYNEDFIDRLNDHDFVGVSDYSNEIFLYFYIRFMEFKEILSGSENSSSSIFSPLADRAVFYKAKQAVGQRICFFQKSCNFFGSLITFIISIFTILLLALLLPFYLVKKKAPNGSLKGNPIGKAIFFIRSEAAYQKCRLKIERMDDTITFYDNYGSLEVPGFSMYSVIHWKNIFYISAVSFAHASRDIVGFFRDAFRMLGFTCALALLPKYVKKIAHKSVYEACLNEIFYLYPEAVFFTGDKDDRFAMLQTRISKLNKMQLLCLPHGLEYGFRFPGGLSGTTFYCFTFAAARFLNELYQESKFVYSDSVADQMYGLRDETQNSKKFDRICFFTEPRDPSMNHDIIRKLIEDGLIFFLKLHPLESSEQYNRLFPKVEQIKDFNEAISSAVCLARKSTVLLDASRRGAKSIALLVNEKDRIYVEKLFPSLCTESIHRAYTFEQLHELL